MKDYSEILKSIGLALADPPIEPEGEQDGHRSCRRRCRCALWIASLRRVLRPWRRQEDSSTEGRHESR